MPFLAGPWIRKDWPYVDPLEFPTMQHGRGLSAVVLSSSPTVCFIQLQVFEFQALAKVKSAGLDFRSAVSE